MASGSKPKRGPNILVTDARERNAPWNRNQRPVMQQRPSTKLISVDNVLQYASQIPSGQRRGPQRPTQPLRSPSNRQPLDPRLTGRMMQQHIPARSSKVSEKLVLLPDTDELESEDKAGFETDDDDAPPKDEELEAPVRPTIMKGKSYAERLPKASRTEKLSRVTAYCTAQAYKLQATAEFVKSRHGAKTKLYDDCLYTVYHLPLLPGNEGYRVRSSPVLKSPGGKALLDEQIERNERHEYQEGYFGEEQYGVKDQHALVDELHPENSSPGYVQENELAKHGSNEFPDLQRRSSSPSTVQLAASISTFAEMFIYSYGVVVFWNFTERQEKDVLADLTFSSSPSFIDSGIPLAVRPLQEEDFETEELHFEYNPEVPRPRLFNDMITLKSTDHMIKLSMSHAISQSTKLSFFEERMADTMEEAKAVPRRLALRGELGMKREEVVRILGRLFMSRVDVNLSSNMLDVPNFFWDSEPTLHPLYAAVREYLEIKPRIQVLNERCRVFLDLAEILSDSINDKKMSRITWIIIILIILSILVTCSEVFLRFGIVSAGKGGEGGSGSGDGTSPVSSAGLGLDGGSIPNSNFIPHGEGPLLGLRSAFAKGRLVP